MKTNCIIIVFVLLTSFGFNISCQTITLGTKWYYGYTMDNPCEFEFQLYETIRDTVISDKTCYMLENSFHDKAGSVSNNPAKEIIYTEDNKVYVYKNDKFHVIFDYTARKGDTITVMDEPFAGFFGLSDEFAPYQLFQYVVDSIDTLDIKSMKYKRFIISGTDNADWTFAKGTEILENIGHYSGGLGNIFGMPSKLVTIISGFCDLRCLKDISFVNYPCDHIGPLSSIETKRKVSELLFYPTIISDKIYFTNDYKSVTIYSLIGQKKTEISPALRGEYDIDHLKQGIYLLEIENNYGSGIFKIIKN